MADIGRSLFCPAGCAGFYLHAAPPDTSQSPHDPSWRPSAEVCSHPAGSLASCADTYSCNRKLAAEQQCCLKANTDMIQTLRQNMQCCALTMLADTCSCAHCLRVQSSAHMRTGMSLPCVTCKSAMCTKSRQFTSAPCCTRYCTICRCPL